MLAFVLLVGAMLAISRGWGLAGIAVSLIAGVAVVTCVELLMEWFVESRQKKLEKKYKEYK